MLPTQWPLECSLHSKSIGIMQGDQGYDQGGATRQFFSCPEHFLLMIDYFGLLWWYLFCLSVPGLRYNKVPQIGRS